MNSEQIIRWGKVAGAVVAISALFAMIQGAVLARTNSRLETLDTTVDKLTETVSLTAYILAEPDSTARAYALRDLRRLRYALSK